MGGVLLGFNSLQSWRKIAKSEGGGGGGGGARQCLKTVPCLSCCISKTKAAANLLYEPICRAILGVHMALLSATPTYRESRDLT